SPLFLLALLAEDHLVRVADAFALVGLRRAEGADLRRHLADALLVRALDLDRGRPLRGDADALRNRIADLVAVAEVEDQLLALHRGAVAGAGHLHRLGEARGDARHHALDQG